MDKYELMQKVFSLDSQRMELENRAANLNVEIQDTLKQLLTMDTSNEGIVSEETKLVLDTFGFQVEENQRVEKEKGMTYNEYKEVQKDILNNQEIGLQQKVSELISFREEFDGHGKPLFLDEQRNLVMDYANKFKDIEKVAEKIDTFANLRFVYFKGSLEELDDMKKEISKFDKVIDTDSEYELIPIYSPVRYDENGQRLWFGKRPEQFTETDRISFQVNNDLALTGKLSKDTETLLKEQGYIFYDGRLYKNMNWENKMNAEKNVPLSNIKVEQQQMHYRGYAYVKGQQKPHILHANTPDEIIMRLQSWNKARPEDLQFKVVNIGSLDNQQNKYTDYHKYEVATGKDISSVYLEIPKMEKEEFLHTVEYLKENGAKYLPNQKKWYITADMDKTPFREFLPNGKAEQTINIQPEDSKEYSLLLSKDVEANECMVAFHDGREPITLHGDQFGVNFAQFKTPDEVVEIVDDFIKKQMSEVKEETLDLDKLQPGDKLECYVPEYSEEGFAEVTGMQKLNAVIEKIDNNSNYYFSECSLPSYSTGAAKSILFSEGQANVISRAIQNELSPDIVRLMTNSNLSVGQLDVIYAAGKDGFLPQQIVDNFVSLPAPDMDMMRIGLQNGVDKKVIQDICGKEMSWAEKRQILNGEIKKAENKIGESFKKQGYPINRETARKVIQLNHCTHQKNKLESIADAFKNQSFKDTNPKAQSLVNDIAKECQTVAAMQSQIPIM